jgi:hypothetical protein
MIARPSISGYAGAGGMSAMLICATVDCSTRESSLLMGESREFLDNVDTAFGYNFFGKRHQRIL